MRMRRLALVTSFAVASGCVQEPSVPKVGNAVIDLTVSTSASTIHIGDPDTITVTATNKVDQQARVLFDVDVPCQILVYIKTVRARVVVPEREYLCAQVSSQLVIPAMSSVKRQFIWRGDAMLDPPGSTTHLPPGDYYVSAVMRAPGFVLPTFTAKVTVLP